MTLASLVLLAVGIAGALAGLRRPVLAAVPVAAAAVAVLVGLLDAEAAGDALGDLVEPLAFLLTAVPLAVLLDELGAFEAVARRLPHRWLAPGLWAVGTVTVALVNLDAAVVLLTPVAVRAARRSGLDPVGLALQPALLSSLASSFLPVSNLTNLIAEQDDPRGPVAFLRVLGPPSIAAVAVGYLAWHLWWRPAVSRVDATHPGPGREPVDDGPALRVAVQAGGVLLVGFTVGDGLGVAPWMVSGLVMVALAVRARRLPLRTVPWTSALTVAGLAVLAVAVADQVDLGRALGSGEGPLGTARLVGVGALGANLTNNLPAFLAGRPALPATDVARWAWLLGVNAGPTVLVTGSLAGILWLDVARRSGLDVSWRDYLRAGLRVGLPALAAATSVLVVLGP